MKEVSFIFLDRVYRGFLAESTEEYPHFYWYFLEDPDLIEDLGDCISFRQEPGGPLELTEPYAKQYDRLLQAIRTVVEQHRKTVPSVKLPDTIN